MEWLEETLLISFQDTNALIADPNNRHVLIVADFEGGKATLRGVFDGLEQQVNEHMRWAGEP